MSPFTPDESAYPFFRTASPYGTPLVSGLIHGSLGPHLDFFTTDTEKNMTGCVTRMISERPNWVAAARLPFDNLPHPDVLIKRFGIRSVLYRLADPMIGSRSLRAMRTAQRMRETGVPTPVPLLSIEKRRHGFIVESWLITALVPDAVKVREILRSNPPGSPMARKALAASAETLRRLHDAGIFHRDLTLGNFLWSGETPDRVYLVDLSRAVRFRRLPGILRVLDLSRLNLGPEWNYFYSLYCEGRPSLLRLRRLLFILIKIRRNSIRLKKFLRGRKT